MLTTEQAILNTLLELEEKAKLMATANPRPNLIPLFSHLDRLTAQLPPGTDPELLHFLQRKSYEKARLKLQGLTAKREAAGRKQ